MLTRPFVIKLIAVPLLATSLCACTGRPPNVAMNKPSASATIAATPTATAAPQTITPENQARVLVGLDDEQTTAANTDDIRVKRVRYLLEELVKKTGEDLVAIAAETDSTSNFIENKYGRRITRQKLLEDMKSFYSDPKLKLKPSYKEAITLQALLEYAK